MGVENRWPSATRTPNNGQDGQPDIPGELKWPTEFLLGQGLQDAPAGCNNPFGPHATIGQGRGFMQFRKSDYEGLRGSFEAAGQENHRALRIYRLWEWVGYVVGFDSDYDAETAPTLFQAHAGTGRHVVVLEMRYKRNHYYWDGFSVSREDGTPIMSLYYEDGQGHGTSDLTDPMEGFYEMKSTATPAKDQKRRSSTPGARGSVISDSTDVDTSSTPWVQFNYDQTPDSLPTVEKQEGGSGAGDKAFSTVYASDLAWARLLKATGGAPGAPMSREPLLSAYLAMRHSMRAAASTVLTSGGYSHTNPDRMQSKINSNIRKKLTDEKFADHWIDFFMTMEHANTLTPTGYKVREETRENGPPSLRAMSGFDSDPLTTGILAGTEPAKAIQVASTPTEQSPYQPAPLPAVKIVIRAPFGYIKPPEGGVGDSFDEPQLVQWYPKDYKYANWTLRTLDTNTRASDKYIFDYAPNEVQYQGLGAEWVEVPRTGDLPLVEFSKWSLMRVTLKFIIANTTIDDLGFKHPDGLVTGVYDKIERLRTMAQRPFPVSALNIDQLLRVSMKRAMVTGEPLEFVITDFSVTSMQRSIETNSNEITSAQCSLTLQEIPIEAAFKSKFTRPKIAPPVVVPAQETTEAALLGVSLTQGETTMFGSNLHNFQPAADSTIVVHGQP